MQGLEESGGPAAPPAVALPPPQASGIDNRAGLEPAGASGPWMKALLAEGSEEDMDAILPTVGPSSAAATSGD